MAKGNGIYDLGDALKLWKGRNKDRLPILYFILATSIVIACILLMLIGAMLSELTYDVKQSSEYKELNTTHIKHVNDNHERWVYVCEKYGDFLCTEAVEKISPSVPETGDRQ